MSSMWRALALVPVLLATAPSSSAQNGSAASYAAPATATQSVASAIDQWRSLRQSSNYRFSDYAGFLIANPDWPDSVRMRGWAEKAMRPDENPISVMGFFTSDKPTTGNGWARLSEQVARQEKVSVRRVWYR